MGEILDVNRANIYDFKVNTLTGEPFDLSTLKGKSMRRAPRPVLRDEIELLDEIVNMDHNIDLCMDIMFVNKIPMLTTIDTTINFRGLVPIASQKHDDIVMSQKHPLDPPSKAELDR